MKTNSSGGHIPLTPNRVVAYNLARARALRGLTQEQAAERIEPYLGKRWSKAVFSAIERSVGSERVREFTADDLVALARAFDLPVVWFLLPPPRDAAGRDPAIVMGEAPDGAIQAQRASAYLDVLFGAPDGREVRDLIDGRIRDALQSSGGHRTEGQAQAARLASRVAGQVIEEVFGDLTTWAANLRDLAEYMDAIQAEARARVREESKGRKQS